MKPLPVTVTSQENCDMRAWASSYSAAVRQRTVCQKTTMSKHGTLPEYMFQRHCVTIEEPVDVIFEEDPGFVDKGDKDNEMTDQTEDEVERDDAEYHQSSDEEAEDITLSSQSVIKVEIGSFAHFLLGVQLRFGQVIRFNNRY